MLFILLIPIPARNFLMGLYIRFIILYSIVLSCIVKIQQTYFSLCHCTAVLFDLPSMSKWPLTGSIQSSFLNNTFFITGFSQITDVSSSLACYPSDACMTHIRPCYRVVCPVFLCSMCC